MRLKEQIHRSIDALDNHSLTLIYEQIQALQRAQADSGQVSSVPSLDEVLELTRCSEGDWSNDVIAEREER